MLREEWGEKFFVRQFSFPPSFSSNLCNYFFSGKADTNAIKTCALHISEQLKTCDLGGVGKQRYVVVVVFFVVLLVVTLPYLVHVRTRGRTTPEMGRFSVLFRKVFSLFLR